MEKYARTALSEGIKSPEDIHVTMESELYRVINLHYNRNNHIEVSLVSNNCPSPTYCYSKLTYVNM
jgi:hypothetical protein